MNPCLRIQQWVCWEKKTFIISKCNILYLLLHHFIWPLSDSPRVSLRFASALFCSFFLVEVLETKRCFSHERSQLWEDNCKLLKWCWAAERGGVKRECFRNFTMSRNIVQNPFLFKWKRGMLGYDEVFSFLENGAVFKPFEGGAWISSGVVMLSELPEMIITFSFFYSCICQEKTWWRSAYHDNPVINLSAHVISYAPVDPKVCKSCTLSFVYVTLWVQRDFHSCRLSRQQQTLQSYWPQEHPPRPYQALKWHLFWPCGQ